MNRELPVTVTGIVQRGKQLGRTLGFPTANLMPEGQELLPPGVYVSRVRVGDKSYRGMTNVGRHPTVPDGPETVETYILDETLDLYGLEISVTLLHLLRPEKRFESIEALRAELERNKQQTRQWFDSHI